MYEVPPPFPVIGAVHLTFEIVGTVLLRISTAVATVLRSLPWESSGSSISFNFSVLLRPFIMVPGQ